MIAPANAPYTLSFSKRGFKDLSSLEPRFQQQVFSGLQDVCLQGMGDIKAMKGEYKGLLRIRIGDFRAVVQVLQRTVSVVEITHRKDAYR
jgi:mRNA-degrading endonuclease RelE of RelBE toxin-antitoxin system